MGMHCRGNPQHSPARAQARCPFAQVIHRPMHRMVRQQDTRQASQPAAKLPAKCVGTSLRPEPGRCGSATRQQGVTAVLRKPERRRALVSRTPGAARCLAGHGRPSRQFTDVDARPGVRREEPRGARAPAPCPQCLIQPCHRLLAAPAGQLHQRGRVRHPPIDRDPAKPPPGDRVTDLRAQALKPQPVTELQEHQPQVALHRRGRPPDHR
jgi:hypothetical protein